MKLVLFIICIFTLNISLSQNPSYQQRLYYSCKVWGFIKYFHSSVSNCQVNWDSVLLKNLPLIKNSISNNDFNDAISNIINAAGAMEIATSPPPDTFPLEQRRNLNFDWLNDPVFRNDLKMKLDTIKSNFRPHTICWIQQNDYSGSYDGWLLFPYDNPIINSNIYSSFPDEYSRLLIFFKYWNIINYFNPYNYILDSPWDSTLFNNILPIAIANDYKGFYLTLEKITTALNDAHVELLTSSNYYDLFYTRSPVVVLRYLQNNYVVVKSLISGISKGDIIISVDGKTTTDWEDSLRQFISAGNSSVFRRYICNCLLCGPFMSMVNIKFIDSLGNIQNKSFLRTDDNYIYMFTYYPNDSLATTKWKKWNCNVGYVNMGNLKKSDVPSMYNALKFTSSIIFDIRNYPNGTAWDIANLIFPNFTCFSKLLMPDVTYPGRFYFYDDCVGVNGNTSYYTGQVIILCNQETQSQAEYTCMILGAMTNSIIVGSQTAGTDGNVSYFNISQDIQTGFTNLGVFYYNENSTERIGIVPDSIVYPTANGIRANRDEVLEKALQIAHCNQSVPNIMSDSKSIITVYPNPAIDRVTIKLNCQYNNQNNIFTFYNIEGQKILKQSIKQEKTEIDIRGLAKGIYILKLTNSDKADVIKFVKE
jgi:carboxyl-terminal processing protease